MRCQEVESDHRSSTSDERGGGYSNSLTSTSTTHGSSIARVFAVLRHDSENGRLEKPVAALHVRGGIESEQLSVIVDVMSLERVDFAALVNCVDCVKNGDLAAIGLNPLGGECHRSDGGREAVCASPAAKSSRRSERLRAPACAVQSLDHRFAAHLGRMDPQPVVGGISPRITPSSKTQAL